MSKLRLLHLLTVVVAFIGLVMVMGGNMNGIKVVIISLLASVLVRMIRFLWRD